MGSIRVLIELKATGIAAHRHIMGVRFLYEGRLDGLRQGDLLRAFLHPRWYPTGADSRDKLPAEWPFGGATGSELRDGAGRTRRTGHSPDQGRGHEIHGEIR